MHMPTGNDLLHCTITTMSSFLREIHRLSDMSPILVDITGNT